MARDDAEDTTIYKVVVNHEEQYSIWPADREPPLGWQEVGQQGLKAEAWPTSRMSGLICDRSACGKKWRRDGIRCRRTIWLPFPGTLHRRR